MSDPLEATLNAVRDQVTPSADERVALEAAVERLVSITESAVTDVPCNIDVIRVGSTARDTWLRGERDIDIFVSFPTGVDREQLEEFGLDIGRAVLPDGRLEYAEHPYVTGEFDGYSVDLVPCYRVESGGEIQSAVDRTPFHARYVKERLTADQTTDVRVLKQFCEAIGIYGSDLKTRGFSGYLTELLVLAYGDVRGVLEAAADWHPPIVLDPADHASTSFDDPLIVVDPTDPDRNVAAVVSDRNVARFQHHARAVLADPDVDRFRMEDPDPLTPTTLEAHLERRSATPIALRVPAPDLVDDQLYPQLERSREGIVHGLEQHGFDVLRSDSFANKHAIVYVELVVSRLPAVERHEGPPVHVSQHAEAFLDRWESADAYGPFIDGDRYVVERTRDVRDASTVLTNDRLFDLRLGSHIRRALAKEYEVLAGREVLDLLPEFDQELARFYQPRP